MNDDMATRCAGFWLMNDANIGVIECHRERYISFNTTHMATLPAEDVKRYFESKKAFLPLAITTNNVSTITAWELYDKLLTFITKNATIDGGVATENLKTWCKCNGLTYSTNRNGDIMARYTEAN